MCRHRHAILTRIMGVDIQRVRSLVSVNGLKSDSPPEEISALLRSANYSQDEIAVALTMLAQPVQQPHADTQIKNGTITTKPGIMTFVQDGTRAKVPLERKVTNYPGTAGHVVSERASGLRPGLFVLGLIMSAVLFALLVLFGIQTKLFEVAFELISHIAQDPGANYITMIWIVPVIGVISGLSWIIARAINKTETVFLGFSTFVAVSSVLWFGFIELAQFVINASAEPSPGLGAISLVIGYYILYATAFLIFIQILALPLYALTWRRKNPHSEIKGAIVAGVVGLLMLVYVSGVLRYPADLLNWDFLCYGVASARQEKECHEATFVLPTSSPTLDIIEVDSDFAVERFAKIQGKLVMTVRPNGPGGNAVLYIDGVRDTRYEDLDQYPLEINGQIVFTAIKGIGDAAQEVLVVGESENADYVGFGEVMPFGDNYAFIGVQPDKTQVIVANGREFGDALQAKRIVKVAPLQNGSVLYHYWTEAKGDNAYIALDNKVVVGPVEGVVDVFEYKGQPGYVYTRKGEVIVHALGKDTVFQDSVATVRVLNDVLFVEVISRENDRSVMYVDGVPHEEYLRYTTPEAVGAGAGYVGIKEDTNDIVIDGKVVGSYPGRAFSFNGAANGDWAFVYSDPDDTKKRTVIYNGERKEDVEMVLEVNGRLVTITKDGYYLGNVLLYSGDTIGSPAFLDGKFIAAGTGSGDEGTQRFIVAEKGLIPDSVRALLAPKKD